MATLDINVRQVNADFQSIKNKIVEKGVEIADGTKTSEYADKVGAVYDAGAKSEYDRFWDAYQDSGNRAKYEFGFSQWSAEYIRPKYKIVFSSANDGNQTFSGNKKLKKIEADYFDFSQKPTGTGNTTGYYYTFSYCTNLEEIEDIGLNPQRNYYYTFNNCYKLHTIARLGVDENTAFSYTFTNCHELQNLTIDGTIGQNGFNVSYGTKLTHDSLMSIINALGDKTGDTSGTSWVCTLGEANLAKLTEAEKAVATGKGWTLA